MEENRRRRPSGDQPSGSFLPRATSWIGLSSGLGPASQTWLPLAYAMRPCTEIWIVSPASILRGAPPCHETSQMSSSVPAGLLVGLGYSPAEFLPSPRT